VICGLSGGVDSAVAAVLLHEAVGEQLTCVFVDHGLMRAAEARRSCSLFRNSYNIPLVHVNAAELFLRELQGVTDPEAKRKTIGRLFIDVFEAEAKTIGGAEFPGAGHALSRRDRERVLRRRALGHDQEPPQCRRAARAHEHAARRALARAVQGRGARARARAWPPEAFVGRHPFPGPGLAIRCPGEITPEKLDILRRADAVYLEEIRRAGLYDQIWQAFAVLLRSAPSG
jgi:GMP synthase (glutamine-hydrolysing)